MKIIKWSALLTFLLFTTAHAFNTSDLEKLFKTKSCPGCDLSGANLSNKDLRKANLEKANLKGAKLVFTKFDEANLRRANLDGAKMMRVDFFGADLEGAVLTNIKKGDMMFQGANLRHADFTNSNLTGGRFGSENRSGKQYPPANITGANFNGVKMDWRLKQMIAEQKKKQLQEKHGAVPGSPLATVLSGDPCLQCDLSGANLENANLEGLILGHVNFQGANLRGVNLRRASLGGAIFVGANMEGADLRKAQAREALFMGANMTNAMLDGAWLDGAEFGPKKFKGKKFPAAILTGATFKGVDLSRIRGLKPAKPVPDSAIVKGGPNKDFLGAELYVVAGGSPMPGEIRVYQIVSALGYGKKSWASNNPGQWMLTFKKKHRKTGKRLNLKMLFTKHNDDSGEGVLMARIIANGQELNKGQIFQFMQKLAIKAEAKQ